MTNSYPYGDPSYGSPFLLDNDDDPEGLGFFPTDLINAEKPRTKKERLAEAVMELVEEDNDSGKYLAAQSHIADLIWVEKELHSLLVSHGDNEYNHAVVRAKIEVLSSALSKRISEMP